MALRIEDEIVTPQSTDAVAFDPDPVVRDVVVSNRSTGAVPYVAPGTTSVAHLDQPVVVAHPLHDGPVTTTVSWVTDLAPADVDDEPDVETKPVAPDVVETPATPDVTTKPVRTGRSGKA